MPSIDDSCKKVESEVQSFVQEYLSPSYSWNLHVSKLFDLHASDFAHRTWPNSTKPGVYLIWSTAAELLYVGQAGAEGASSLGPRLSSHFPTNRGGKAAENYTGFDDAQFVATIAFKRDVKWFAFALEQYLKDKLKPATNIR